MIFTFFLINYVSSSVIGYDLGTAHIKAGVFRSGRSIEVVLNEQSKRKTPALVSFEGDVPVTTSNVRRIDRRIGLAAQAVLRRNSSSVFRSFTSIIGKKDSSELIDELRRRKIDFNMTGDSVNGIKPEVVLAMLFERYSQHAKHQLQQDTVDTAVVAVPSFFTDEERNKVARAVEMSGLKLSRIIDQNRALAVQYAVDKHETFITQPRNIVIIDFGAGSLNTAAVRFSTKVVTPTKGRTKKIPIIEDLLYTWNDTIGGMDFDIMLAEHLKKKWNLQKVDQTLIDDAERIKVALTLGETCNVSSDTLERKVIFTRSEFEEVCKPLFDKVRQHLEEFSKSLKVKIDAVEIVGGSTRMPQIIDMIQKILGCDISRSLNADEAIVCGATFTATSASGSFKTSDIIHKHVYPYSLNIIIGNRTIPFKPKANIQKQTIRFQPFNDTSFSIEYAGKIPVGADRVIGNWTFEQIPEEWESRILFSLQLNPVTSCIEPIKFSLARKVGKSVSKKNIDIEKVYPPKEDTRDYEEASKLVKAFTANDLRLAKIAEVRNEYETQLFNAKDNFENDEIWSVIMSPEEKSSLQSLLNESYEWVYSKVVVETADEIVERRKELDAIILPIQLRASEYKTYPKSVQDLKDLIQDINITLDNKWPLSGIKAPREQKKSIISLMNDDIEWLEECELEIEVRHLKPWDDLPATTKDVELRIRKLSAMFDKMKESVRRNDEL